MREEYANAVETGRDGWRRAGWMVGLREKERRGSGDSVTFWQGQSFSLDDVRRSWICIDGSSFHGDVMYQCLGTSRPGH